MLKWKEDNTESLLIDAGSECENAIDMFEEDEGVDDSKESMTGEEDTFEFLQIDARFETDIFKEEECADGRFWKDNGLEYDALELQKQEEGIGDFVIDKLKREEDTDDFLEIMIEGELDADS